ncbi:mechanosensitive ion channel family protein [Cellvibrio sp.]|uniref:mechanosensitive ion channel family protein n=1 Tax=Cellvibrio sp. TaxID=1965322 RepID=UPI003964842C
MLSITSIDEKIMSESLTTKLLLVCVCIMVFYLATKLLNKIAHDVSVRKALGDERVPYITKLMNIGMVFCCIVVMCLLLGLGYSEVSVFLSSIFAVVGVGLFAQWSILSNVTASMIIFFGFPYRIGDRIKIADKDEDMCGVIEEISMFHVILRRDDGNLITYPNSMVLQKAVIKIEQPEAKTVEKTIEDSAAAEKPAAEYFKGLKTVRD